MSAALALTTIEASLALTGFQGRVLSTPEENDLFLGGGRGGGKSYALAFLYLRHIETYGNRARMLYVRRSFPGIVDFEQVTREVFGLLLSRGVLQRRKPSLAIPERGDVAARPA